MKKLIHFIPNALTLSNLMCGTVAIIFAFDNRFEYVFWAVIAAAFFDFFDGAAARMLNAHSPIGGDLDSLADMVSFGLAPSLAVYSLLAPFGWVAYLGLMMIPGAALRLAKFNIDERQHTEFLGLPTPAMALFFVSFIFTALFLPSLWIMVALIVTMTVLMVCNMPMFSLKFANFSWHDNVLRYLFLGSVVLIILLTNDVYMVPWVSIALYIVVSFVRWIVR
ncbi:MAG: CDP-diacylglycerol--serine O-phosphatidyltransferase [Mucinivorans sp.]